MRNAREAFSVNKQITMAAVLTTPCILCHAAQLRQNLLFCELLPEVRGQEHDQIIIFLIFAATQEAFSFFNTSLSEVEAMQA